MKSISSQSRWAQRARSRRRLGVVPGVLVALLGARGAHADCSVEPPSLEFTYPNEATESVPPDAVFWVVSPAGEARAWIDDVPLSPRGTAGVERHQFVTPVPLSEGEHELVTRAGSDDLRTIPFRVAAQPQSTGDVSVDAVTFYPPSNRYPARNPPESEYDNECMQYVVRLNVAPCYDTGAPPKARVTYAGQGDAIAYLAQGRYLVSPACATFWAYSAEEPQPADYVVAAVLPTGIGEEHHFDGTIEVRAVEETYPDAFDGPDACSLAYGLRSPSPLAGVGLVLATWIARRRKRENDTP